MEALNIYANSGEEFGIVSTALDCSGLQMHIQKTNIE